MKFNVENENEMKYLDRILIIIYTLTNTIRLCFNDTYKEIFICNEYTSISKEDYGNTYIKNINTNYNKLYKYMKYVNKKMGNKVYEETEISYTRNISERYLLDIEYDKELQNIYITDQKGKSCTYYAHVLPLYYISLYDGKLNINEFMNEYGAFYCGIIKKYVSLIKLYIERDNEHIINHTIEKNTNKSNYFTNHESFENKYDKSIENNIGTLSSNEIIQILMYYYNFIKKENNKPLLLKFIPDEIEEYKKQYEKTLYDLINKNITNEIFTINKNIDNSETVIYFDEYNMNRVKRVILVRFCKTLFEIKEIKRDELKNPEGKNIFNDLLLLVKNYDIIRKKLEKNDVQRIYKKLRILLISQINFVFENTIQKFIENNDDYFKNNSIKFDDIFTTSSIFMDDFSNEYLYLYTREFQEVRLHKKHYNIIQLILILLVIYDSKKIEENNNIDDNDENVLKNILLDNLPLQIYWLNSNIFNKFYSYLLLNKLKFNKEYNYFFTYNTFNFLTNSSNKFVGTGDFHKLSGIFRITLPESESITNFKWIKLPKENSFWQRNQNILMYIYNNTKCDKIYNCIERLATNNEELSISNIVNPLPPLTSTPPPFSPFSKRDLN